MKASRNILFICAFALVCGALGTRPVAAQCEWSAVAQHLSDQPDERSKRAAENLSHLCSSVTLLDIQKSAAAKKCLGSSTPVFSETDAAILAKPFGSAGRSTLRLLLPALGTFFGRTVTGIIGGLLISTPLGRDAIDTISHPDTQSRENLNAAARFLIWNTDPPAFKDQLSTDRKAAVCACLLAQ